jgi:NADH-quinone oxidoreductase subunit D
VDGALAMELGITGPTLRAAGIDHDLRRDAPYHCYDEIDLRVVTAQAGDCEARGEVRLAEMRESIRIVRLLIEGIPEGPLGARRPIKTPLAEKALEGHAYAAVESPRGELGVYVIGGGENKGASPYRLKIRSPSLHVLSCLPYVLPGHSVSDAVAVLGSIDPIMGEVDR